MQHIFAIKQTFCTLKGLKRILNFIHFNLPSDKVFFSLTFVGSLFSDGLLEYREEAHTLLLKKKLKAYSKIYPRKLSHVVNNLGCRFLNVKWSLRFYFG